MRRGLSGPLRASRIYTPSPHRAPPRAAARRRTALGAAAGPRRSPPNAFPTGPDRNFSRDGQRSRDRKPEGRGGQDHHRREPRRQHRGCGLSHAAGRSRPAVQRYGCTWASEGRRAERLRLPVGRPQPHRGGDPERHRRARRRAVHARPRRRQRRAAAHLRLRDDPARPPRQRARPLPVHAARLPALARPAHGQRPGGGRPRDRARCRPSTSRSRASRSCWTRSR